MSVEFNGQVVRNVEALSSSGPVTVHMETVKTCQRTRDSRVGDTDSRSDGLELNGNLRHVYMPPIPMRMRLIIRGE